MAATAVEDIRLLSLGARRGYILPAAGPHRRAPTKLETVLDNDSIRPTQHPRELQQRWIYIWQLRGFAQTFLGERVGELGSHNSRLF